MNWWKVYYIKLDICVPFEPTSGRCNLDFDAVVLPLSGISFESRAPGFHPAGVNVGSRGNALPDIET